MSVKFKALAFGAGTLLASSLAFAGSASASAIALPDCGTSIQCTSNSAGEAGYYGADDNHTHYRFVETTVAANDHLVNLNGSTTPGAIGVRLCDPNTSNAQQIGIWWDAANGPNGGFDVSYGEGKIGTGVNDPCVQGAFSRPLGDNAGDAFELVGPTAPTTVHINLNDQIYIGEYYDPSGKFFHQLSYGMCDITANWCRQAWSSFTTQQEFFEFGIGALSTQPTLTGGAINFVDSLTANRVTCYACESSVPITSVKGFYGPGGLTEAQWINSASQIEMSPNDSLEISNDTFSLLEGSVSP